MSKVVGIFILGILAGWVMEWVFVRLFVPNPKKKVEAALQASRKENENLQKQTRELQVALTSAQAASISTAPVVEAVVLPEPEKTAEVEALPEPEPVVEMAAEPAIVTESEGNGNDDLTKLSGIGPKLAEAMKAAGIGGYVQIAAMSTDELNQRLAPSGIRYSKASAESWAAQAVLAVKGDWDGLKAYQTALKS
jgi:small subunit ribosomal protein S2